MARPRKAKVTPEPDAPLKCKFCEADLTDKVLGDPPVCPLCGESVKLKDKPLEGIQDQKTETSEPAPVIFQPRPESYGIRANVIIPQISDIEVNKVAINKDGKMVTKITLEVENLNEISLLRIIHMMSSRVQMHATIGADKMQTDFLDLIDPKTTKEALAQVSRKDLEEKGFFALPELDTCTRTTSTSKPVVGSNGQKDELHEKVQSDTGIAKDYRLFRRATTEFKDISAPSAQEACEQAGWKMEDCWVREYTKSDATKGLKGNGWMNVTPRELKPELLPQL